MVVTNPTELRAKDADALVDLVKGYKKELLELRAAQATNGLAAKAGKIRVCRKNIARALTILTEKHIEAAREKYANSKCQPKDLKPKLTRRLRQMMTPRQRALVPLKVLKRQQNFPMRSFAIKKKF